MLCCGSAAVGPAHPLRIELPAEDGSPAWTSASVKYVADDRYRLRFDASEQAEEAELLSNPLEPGAALQIRLGNKTVTARVAVDHAYAAGTRLLVLQPGGLATAVARRHLDHNKHRLLLEADKKSAFTCDLNPYNHCEAPAAFTTADDYERARKAYVESRLAGLEYVEDAITGHQLKLAEQARLAGWPYRPQPCCLRASLHTPHLS